MDAIVHDGHVGQVHFRHGSGGGGRVGCIGRVRTFHEFRGLKRGCGESSVVPAVTTVAVLDAQSRRRLRGRRLATGSRVGGGGGSGGE